jgi:hypothetical protein
MEPTAAFLLLILQVGVPAPLFVIPMPDARTCQGNLMAMEQILDKKKAVTACFDMKTQVNHIAPRAGPREGEEEIN